MQMYLYFVALCTNFVAWFNLRLHNDCVHSGKSLASLNFLEGLLCDVLFALQSVNSSSLFSPHLGYCAQYSASQRLIYKWTSTLLSPTILVNMPLTNEVNSQLLCWSRSAAISRRFQLHSADPKCECEEEFYKDSCAIGKVKVFSTGFPFNKDKTHQNMVLSNLTYGNSSYS